MDGKQITEIQGGTGKDVTKCAWNKNVSTLDESVHTYWYQKLRGALIAPNLLYYFYAS